MMDFNPFEIESYVGLVFGPRGSAKTTAALDGDGRKAYMELDIGSLQRAAAGLELNPDNFDYYRYRLPPTSLRDRGRISTKMAGESGKGAATVVHTLRGWEDLSAKFTNEFCDFCEDYRWLDIDGTWTKVKADEPYTDIVIDTGNLCWDMLQSGTREKIQRELPHDQWEKELKRLEFEDPNTAMWDMCNYAKAYRKNLIFTSMESYPWVNSGPSPGYDYSKPKADGNKYLPGYADFEMRMEIKMVGGRRQPVGHLTKVAAGGLDLLDVEVPLPTVRNVITLLNTAAKMRRQKIPFSRPVKYEDIMAIAAEMES